MSATGRAQFADVENRWRAVSLIYCAALGAVLLVGFAAQHLLMDDPLPAVFALLGLPFMFVTAMQARQKPVMSSWAPYPAIGFLLALLLVMLLLPDVFRGAALMWFCAVPPTTILALRSKIGLLVSGFMLAAMVFALLYGRHELANDYAIRLCIAYTFIAAIVYTYERSRERAMIQLLEAETRIATLEGMLRICGWCHQRMQDDGGQWVSTEHYLQRRLPVKFTHGMCPDCVAKVERELQSAS